MSSAVALVETYLRVNGFFTVSEYPVIEAADGGGFRESTDLDLLGFRFPYAGRLVPTPAGPGAEARFEADPKLSSPVDAADMVICEVKEGQARFNSAIRRPSVLRMALLRFGCCRPDEVDQAVDRLLASGRVTTATGHPVRFVSFGSTVGPSGQVDVSLSLEHVIRFLEAHLETHWPALHNAQFRDPALGFLAVRRKAVTSERRRK